MNRFINVIPKGSPHIRFCSLQELKRHCLPGQVIEGFYPTSGEADAHHQEFEKGVGYISTDLSYRE